MLKIEKMQIAGFKSFSDATEVVFPDGITAVVGPNGCGKSNIGDAINWVLGEQSAKMLRGASMQDVIFNGTEARRPQGMAEVSLHLASRALDEAGEPKQITITRRLFRDGESDYLLNGSKSRLRDIQDLLREERVGAQTYATIEQGRIDQILNAKPKDRRLIIEEAAGIAGFKHKRRLAELKLEATQANLLRVNDIVLEVTRQINALKRQAAKARRYGRLRDELRAKEAVRFGARAKRLDAELAAHAAGEARARASEAEAATRLASMEASIVAERTSLDEEVQAGRAAAEALHQLEIEIDRGEARIRSCRERIAESQSAIVRLGEDLAALAERSAAVLREREAQDASLAEEESAHGSASAALAEQRRQVEAQTATREIQRERVEALRRGLFEATHALADAKNALRSVEEGAARAAAQRERLAREQEEARLEHTRVSGEAEGLGERSRTLKRTVDELRAEVAQAEAAVAEARTRHAEGVAALAAVKERETAAASELRTLDDVSTRFAGVSDGVRLLLTSGAKAGVRTSGVVADFVQASREMEGAAESYLQGLLPAVVVEDDGDASRAASLIRREGAGRTIVLCKSQPQGALAVGVASNGHVPIPEAMRRDPRVIGRLKDGLELRAGDGFVGSRIGDAVLVDSLESALALHRDFPHVDYLASTGEIVYASGMIAAGGRAASEHGLLAHNRRTADARRQLGEQAAGAREAQGRVDELARALAESEAAWSAGRRALETEGRRGVEVELLARRTDDERARTVRRLDVLREEDEAAALEAERLAAALAETGAAAASAAQRHADLAMTLEVEIAALDRSEALLSSLVDAEAAARADVAGRAQRVEAARREGARLAETAEELAARARQAEAEREEAATRERDAAAIIGTTETELAEQWERRRLAQLEASAREETLASRRSALQEQEASSRELRAALDRAREEVREGELRRTRAESDRRFLDDLCAQELGTTAAEAAALAGAEAIEGADEASLEAEIADIKSRVEAIGPVNLMAIDEFRALEERHAGLTTQQRDLEEAVLSLRESIKRINRSSRDRFLEAFEIIRGHYVETFKVLFGGGRADLVLEEGEDVLECGIEMIAQPPGKRLGHVSLMSGGEKAMAALALLFAIFRYQPSPFCLLDEVDAALDELNIGRFTRMLAEYAHQTQFILITHNKRSMEAANLLYGVTMEESGVSKLVSMRL